MRGAMRVAQSTILVLWLIYAILICIGSVVGARKTLFPAHNGSKDDNDSLTTTMETTTTLGSCKSKNLHCCECFFSSSEEMAINNGSSSSEEKRVVPTGPNPLHNK